MDIKQALSNLKNQHHSARHWCYAYQLGVGKTLKHRTNDDGEPNNTAGIPIYGQIKSHKLTNILIVVVRYYGGIKLGVRGLINAYKTAAAYTIDAASIIEKTIYKTFRIVFEYKAMSQVRRILKLYAITIIHQKLEHHCVYHIAVRDRDADKIFNHFDHYYGVQIEPID